MKQETKLFAEFFHESYRNDGDETTCSEIKSVEDAVEQGLQARAAYFRTYEVTVLELDGKKYTGEKENFSSKHYLGRTVYTPEEAIKAEKREFEKLTQEMKMWGRKPKDHELSKEFTEASADTRYVGMIRAFVKLEEGDAVYDSKGEKVWPAAHQPVSPKS